MNKDKVLFLCSGNSARSQMAEALLRQYAYDRFEVYSAGLAPKPLNPFTVKVMEEVDIYMNQHRSKSVSEYLGKVHFTYLITVCSKAEENCPTTFLGVANRLYWPFDDPSAFGSSDEERLAKFRQVRDQIDLRIKEWLADQNILVDHA